MAPWRRRTPLEEARRREFLWAVGGERALEESLVRVLADRIEQDHGVRLTERELRTLVRFVPSLPDAWAKGAPGTSRGSGERFVEERAAAFVRELDLTRYVEYLKKREHPPPR